MYNYLSVVGLGITGYLLGFKFVILCTSIYNLFKDPNISTCYRLFMTYLFYSMTFFEILYFFALSSLYNVLSDYDKYKMKLNSVIDEYNNFMKFYNEEVTKDQTKASIFVEYWKKATHVYYQLVMMYYEIIKRVSENKYYYMISEINLGSYVDYINCLIDDRMKPIENYLNGYFETIKGSIEKYDNLSGPNVPTNNGQHAQCA